MYLKVVGYRGNLLPNWARDNSLDVPSEAEFQAGSTALINHWNHDPEILSLGTDVGEFTKSQINAVFNPNQFYDGPAKYRSLESCQFDSGRIGCQILAPSAPNRHRCGI